MSCDAGTLRRHSYKGQMTRGDAPSLRLPHILSRHRVQKTKRSCYQIPGCVVKVLAPNGLGNTQPHILNIMPIGLFCIYLGRS